MLGIWTLKLFHSTDLDYEIMTNRVYNALH